MIVFGLFKDTKSTSGMVSYSVNIERRLDGRFWGKNVVFPFARQRQYDSKRTGLSWKLW